MTIADAMAPAAALRLVASAVAGALIYLWLAMMWVASASAVFVVIGRRVLAEGSPVLLAASTFPLHIVALFVLLTPVAVMLMALRCWIDSKSNVTKDNADEAKEPAEERPRQKLGVGVIIRKMLQDPIILGVLIALPFKCLMLAGFEVMETSPEKGSPRERIGSMLKDLGMLGISAIICFITLPAMALKVWRMKQGGDVIRLFCTC